MDGEKGESFCLSFDGKVSRGEFLIIEKKKKTDHQKSSNFAILNLDVPMCFFSTSFSACLKYAVELCPQRAH